MYYIWKRRLGKDEIKQSKVVKGMLFVLLGVVLIYGCLLYTSLVNRSLYTAYVSENTVFGNIVFDLLEIRSVI